VTSARTLTWEIIFGHWGLVWADLISEYGFDLGDRARMRAGRWTSLKHMIIGLCSADTRLSRALSEDAKK
jgi:hypothetical protein